MWVTAYTDASFIPNTRRSAYGIWLKCDIGVFEHASECPYLVNTSELAEAYAVYAGVYWSFKQWSGVTGVHVVSDCQNIVNSFSYKQWMERSKLHKKIGDEIAIKSMPPRERILFRMYMLLKNNNDARITLRWVKSHQSSRACRRAWVNNRVDAMAYRIAVGKDR